MTQQNARNQGMITACGIDRSGKLLCYGNNDPTISQLGTNLGVWYYQEGLQVVGQAEPPEGRYRQLVFTILVLVRVRVFALGLVFVCVLVFGLDTHEQQQDAMQSTFGARC
eukprot:1087841-Rhodomonas_salina.1